MDRRPDLGDAAPPGPVLQAIQPVARVAALVGHRLERVLRRGWLPRPPPGRPRLPQACPAGALRRLRRARATPRAGQSRPASGGAFRVRSVSACRGRPKRGARRRAGAIATSPAQARRRLATAVTGPPDEPRGEPPRRRVGGDLPRRPEERARALRTTFPAREAARRAMVGRAEASHDRRRRHADSAPRPGPPRGRQGPRDRPRAIVHASGATQSRPPTRAGLCSDLRVQLPLAAAARRLSSSTSASW